VKPKVVVRIDFAEWTGADKLRHPKLVALRDDKNPRQVVREAFSTMADRYGTTRA
jgi:ATP-dependent DNA ligase